MWRELQAITAIVPLFIILMFAPDSNDYDKDYTVHEFDPYNPNCNTYVTHYEKVDRHTHNCIDTVKIGDRLPESVKSIHYWY